MYCKISQTDFKKLLRALSFYFTSDFLDAAINSITWESPLTYRKRCGTEITETQSLGTTDTQLGWRAYRSSRSLSHYDFTVTFGIAHIGSTITESPEYNIKDGY